MSRYFPIAVHLQGRTCVVIGGGNVASRRIESLLDAGAIVRVVAPSITSQIRGLVPCGRLQLCLSAYETEHLNDAWLVLAATDDPVVNAAVCADASSRGILCGDAESPECGDFILGASLHRGNLSIAVTTGGASPAVAARIRDQLAEQFGPEYGEYLELLAELREKARVAIPDKERRHTALRRLALDDSIRELIRDGRSAEARTRAEACIYSSSD